MDKSIESNKLNFNYRDDLTISKLFEPLWADIREKDQFYNLNPILAHYTSIEIFESILRNNELWFSNPFFMNDIAEVKYVLSEAIPLIYIDKSIEAACGSSDRYDEFRNSFKYYYNIFANEHISDTYIFCLSQHEKENTDGSLSMWRGYGCNGNGVAILIDAAKIGVIDDSPLMLSKVKYLTKDELLIDINKIISSFVVILASSDIPTNKLYLASHNLLERIKLLSLFVKHKGFEEEKEWRIVYQKERDPNKKLTPMIDYLVRSNSIEPKLKLKIEPLAGVTPDGLSLKNVVDKIILGPSISSPIAMAAIQRMLCKYGQAELKDKVYTSGIPFRAR